MKLFLDISDMSVLYSFTMINKIIIKTNKEIKMPAQFILLAHTLLANLPAADALFRVFHGG
jgi:hypothetical protein